ncbi:MAG: aspartate kinase [Bacteroidetes bacterium]|nr:MAG: aspartate kinase [Bacteroidota bacterium]
MITISEAVKDLLTQLPFLEEALSDNLVNVSSLARKLLPDIEKKLKKPVKEGAVIMAINRLAPNYYHKINIGIKDFVTHLGDFTVRSDLVDYTYANTESLRKKQSIILNQLENQSGVFYTFSQGVNETTIIVSNSQETLMDELFKTEILISKKTDLATITMGLPVENTEISGFYYFILKNLAWEGVNIMDVISTTNEFTIVVKEEDTTRAFSILRRIKKG